MARIAFLVEYSGDKFHGSQYQAGLRTVQADLESALATLYKVPVRAIFSGRTDSGVHAKGQVVHFDEPQESSYSFNPWRFAWSMNGILKNDASVVSAQAVPDRFHARFSATDREYVYKILNRPQRSAILRDTHYFVPFPLNLELMTIAAQNLVGTHDFASFRSTNSDRSSTVCIVSRSELLNLGEGQLEFWIVANHFVYNMVRIIVGTLVEIGLGKKTPEGLTAALSQCNRDLAGPTAPAWGLTLNSVKYPDEYLLFAAAAADYDKEKSIHDRSCIEGPD